jgi:hypothetical protein
MTIERMILTSVSITDAASMTMAEDDALDCGL